MSSTCACDSIPTRRPEPHSSFKCATYGRASCCAACTRIRPWIGRRFEICSTASRTRRRSLSKPRTRGRRGCASETGNRACARRSPPCSPRAIAPAMARPAMLAPIQSCTPSRSTPASSRCAIRCRPRVDRTRRRSSRSSGTRRKPSGPRSARSRCPTTKP